MENKWTIAAYVCTMVMLVLFAGIACVLTILHKRKVQRCGGAGDTTADFIAAKGSQTKWRIAWSFYAGALGSWVVVTPANYASTAGLIGLVMYSFSSLIPILIVARCGERVLDMYPDVLTFTDFTRRRYGRAAELAFNAMTVFNMAVVLLAEYVTVGSLFRDYVGSVSYGIIIAEGLLTMIYTAYGGLSISIITDKFQAGAGFILLVVLLIYLAIDFRMPLPTPLTDVQIGNTTAGLSSILSMPVSLTVSTLCSEAMWQRVWASEDKKALRHGAVVGSICAGLVVFAFGFGGFLSGWAGLIKPTTNPNLYWFLLFSTDGKETLSSWAGLITLISAIIMSESAVDSLQNGINGTLISTFLRDKPVSWCRAGVVLVNIPLMIVASLGLVDNVLNLFVVTNMMAACVMGPIMLGLLPGPMAQKYITQFSVLFGAALALITVSVYGIGVTGSFGGGLKLAWYSNGYAWQFFLLAPCSSMAGVIIAIGIEVLWHIVRGTDMKSMNMEKNSQDISPATPISQQSFVDADTLEIKIKKTALDLDIIE